MYVLDTSILSELTKRHPNDAFLHRLRQVPPSALFTASICVMELRYGAALRSDDETFWHRIQQEILAHVHVLEVGEREALVAGEVLAHFKRAGRPIGLEDILIGAVARSRGYTVVTRNTRHFQLFPGLHVEDWCQ